MKHRLLLVFVALMLCAADGFSRLRVVVMTDFPPVDVISGGMGFGPAEKRSDSDDVQSMGRFLLYVIRADRMLP